LRWAQNEIARVCKIDEMPDSKTIESSHVAAWAESLQCIRAESLRINA